MAIKNVFVVGSGVMGSGIAQVTAEAGYNVTMMDIKDEFIKKGLANIENSLNRKIKKGTMQESDKAKTMSRIKTTTDLKDARDADLVIECVPEELPLKRDTFKQLDSICRKDTILASNTSALPISGIAAAAKSPERVIGTHFMNPVPMMKGVEVIPAAKTSAAVLEATKAYVKSIDKEPCIAKDYAGFIVTRIMDVMVNEGVQLVMDGNDPAEIDKAMKLCGNFPMGPLELCDLAGAEIVLHGAETMAAEFGERMMSPALLKSQVRAGLLGRKTGRGFYDYTQK